MAIGKSSPALLRRHAHAAFGPTGHSLPESMATLTDRACVLVAWFLVGLVTPPQPFAEAERKASPNGPSIIRFPVNCLRLRMGFSAYHRRLRALASRAGSGRRRPGRAVFPARAGWFST